MRFVQDLLEKMFHWKAVRVEVGEQSLDKLLRGNGHGIYIK